MAESKAECKTDCKTDCKTACDKKCGKVRLIYFNLRGRAELIRWILTVGKADWEDSRIAREDWPKHKPEMPLGQLPVLECECDGHKKQMTQTATIVRATAHWFCLGGKTPEECVKADEAFEVIREILDTMGRAYFEQDAARKEALMTSIKNELLPRNLAYLEKHLQACGCKFLAGGECFTYADLALACFFDQVKQSKAVDCEEWKPKFPGLANLADRVWAIPELQDWIAKRPQTDM